MQSFRSQIDILHSDEATARSYGFLKSQLRRAGKPIPENDLWMASLAHQQHLTVAARNSHLSFVPEILYEAW